MSMGIYIEGMEMPTEEQSVITINIYSDGVVTCYDDDVERKAVPVPPHGKLGDLDALIATYERQIERHKEQAEKAAMKGTGYTNDMYIIDRNRDIISALKAAPTIIEADKEVV